MRRRLRVVDRRRRAPGPSFLAALLRSVRRRGRSSARRRRAREAVALIEREHPDLALLDWQMPELDGIGVVRMLKKADLPLVAFVTAYDEYAVRAFEVNAVDYLLKPVEKARLREALEPRAGADRARRDRRRAGRARRRTPIDSLRTSARPPLPRADSGPAARRDRARAGRADRVDRRRRRAAPHDDAQRTNATPSPTG